MTTSLTFCAAYQCYIYTSILAFFGLVGCLVPADQGFCKHVKPHREGDMVAFAYLLRQILERALV
jgi:hypothetical protein